MSNEMFIKVFQNNLQEKMLIHKGRQNEMCDIKRPIKKHSRKIIIKNHDTKYK